MYIAQEADAEASKFIRRIGKTLIAIWIGFIAFGESAGRARAAAELHRQGFYKEAKALMLEQK
tara:strand:+ start:272 stop:460 length:189 start_codon:yes stop_codon:yes gene_type:complete